ncbi:hypothetical protein [Salinihabitans flavidus]|uniref:hypothetical protein n=1 Tax=Salinihabitans flavidus TaxID=569882 RepID=UPI001C31C5DC|nr:hypothetical protein [Salinihabitans flavidus]
MIGISWPRSGHRMLVGLLKLYFGKSFGYCNFHSGKPSVEDISTCCKQIPCKHAGRIMLTKNHDFDLSVPQLEGEKYLIQYRDFAPSVVSNFELFVRNGNEDSVLSFRKFVSNQFSRYLDFVNKWVHSPFAQDQLVLNYGTFLDDPHGELQRTIRYFDPEAEPDTDRIAQAIAEVDGQKIEQKTVKALHKSGVHGDRDLRQFRHYSPALFDEIERLRLPRQTVIAAFRKHLGRAPSELNILRFQGYESKEAFEVFLQDSKEYRLLKSKGLA